ERRRDPRRPARGGAGAARRAGAGADGTDARACAFAGRAGRGRGRVARGRGGGAVPSRHDAAAGRARRAGARRHRDAAPAAAVGAGLARGAANAKTNPTVALLAYQEALAADVRSGNGVFAAELRAALSSVAPAAAAAFFDEAKYEQARAACDIAGGDRAAAV